VGPNINFAEKNSIKNRKMRKLQHNAEKKEGNSSKKIHQAGLSRATLEISSEFPHEICSLVFGPP
jgi:hypothetical protein